MATRELNIDQFKQYQRLILHVVAFIQGLANKLFGCSSLGCSRGSFETLLLPLAHNLHTLQATGGQLEKCCEFSGLVIGFVISRRRRFS